MVLLAALFPAGMSPVSAAPLVETVAIFRHLSSNPGNGALVAGPDGCYWGTGTAGGTAGAGTVYKIKPDGSDWRTVVSIPGEFSDVAEREDRLTWDGAGFLWGALTRRGLPHTGILYKVDALSGEFSTVVKFTGSDGANPGGLPRAGLLNDGAGYFWGLTASGGASDHGTIFKVNIRTGELTTLVQFSGFTGTERGANSVGRLVSDGAGSFWGVTSEGGSLSRGTVFKIDAASGVMTTLVHFTGGNGATPAAALLHEGGFMWGTTSAGGANNAGTVFKVNTATGALTSVVQFTGTAGARPGKTPRELVSDGAGSLAGTTESGGAEDYGTLFKVNVATESFTPLAAFTGEDGAWPGVIPLAALLNDGAGSVWGTTVTGGTDGAGTLFRVNTATGVVTVTKFTGTDGDTRGSQPLAGLVATGSGSLLGTTSAGGALDRGTLFNVNTGTGNVTTVFEFDRFNPDLIGAEPVSGLTADANGFLWGTTIGGGSAYKGTIYKLDPATGTATTPVEFNDSAAGVPGSQPHAGLLPDDSGFLWGTTTYGGEFGKGTVFKVNAGTGELTSLADFQLSDTGQYPRATLVRDVSGYFFGATLRGGSEDVGTIYGVNPANGSIAAITHLSVQPGVQHPSPSGALVSDGAGYYWGTTTQGGSTSQGSIFKVHIPTGYLTTVLEFRGTGPGNPGAYPKSGLVSDGLGYLWGTTELGGWYNWGTVFKVDAVTGVLFTMAHFSFNAAGTLKGFSPNAGLARDASGDLWGTTRFGGKGEGTVFQIRPFTGQIATIQEFSGTYGLPGPGSLFRHTDGHFYGITTGASFGGPFTGSIYRLRFGPAPVTLPADVAETAATLRGTVNPNGTDSTASFEWGTNPDPGTFTIISTGNTGNGSAPVPVSAELAGLIPGTAVYYRVVAENSDNAQPQRGRILSFTPGALTALEVWRQTYFGTTGSAGNAADLFDFDNDGLVNLLEFAFGLNPTDAKSRQLPTEQINGGNVEITFSRPPGVSGILYTAEASPSLMANPWSAVPNSAAAPHYSFRVPAGQAKHFLRLRISLQPQ